MVNVTLNTKSKSCIAGSTFLGYEGENSANKLIFEFMDEFIDGSAQLNIKRGNDNGYVALVKVGETYELEVKSSLVSQIGEVTFQLQVSKADGTIYKFDTFVMTVKDAIDSDIPLPEEYPTWQEAMATALAEVENIDIFATKIDNVATVTVTDKNGVITEVEIYDGADGKDGVDGLDGANGIDGENGKDGVSPTFATEQVEGGAKLTITDVNGTHVVTLKDGPEGKQGPQGPQGEKGPQGPQGEKGADGTMSFEELTEEQKATLKGDKGDTGPQGERGPQGEQGPKGDTGATGPEGPQGPKGDKGDKGDTGETGATGETGPQGETGPAGANGLTPHIGTNGNWWIGDTDTGTNAGGSGTGGSGRITALFNTGAKDKNTTYTLSDSIDNYDLILTVFGMSSDGTTLYTQGSCVTTSGLLKIRPQIGHSFYRQDNATAGSWTIVMDFTSSTEFTITEQSYSTSWYAKEKPTVGAVYGIKF